MKFLSEKPFKKPSKGSGLLHCAALKSVRSMSSIPKQKAINIWLGMMTVHPQIS